MVDTLRSSIGFSWIGLAFLVMLFVPNILWARSAPPEFAELSASEPAWLVGLERTGQVLACITLLLAKKLQVGVFSPRSFLLIAALILMIVYELFWIRYFAGPRSVRSFYEPFAGIPVPGALLPVAAMLCLGIYAGSPLIIAAACVLGIGHIGIHALHALSLTRVR